MFFSNVSVAEKYNYLEEKFTVAYKWLAETNIKDLPEGSYPLMGDDVIAGVQEYTTSPWEERRFETHDKYFDIQFMVTGNEMFGVCKRDGLKEINRIEENDVVFYEDPDLFVYTRDLEDHRLLVVCNLSGHNRIYVPDEVFRHAEVLIHSGPDIQDCSPCAESGILRPYESYVLYL